MNKVFRGNLLKFILAAFALMIIPIAIVSIVLMYFSYDLPKIASLDDYDPPVSSLILSKDGTVLLEIGSEKREVVPLSEVSTRILDAFLSAEDSGFYLHQGVDYLGIARALLMNIKAGKVVQGGSTITQQVAKSLLLNSERSISRKVKDFLLALKIEKHLTKDEILYLYLNQVYLGAGFYGVKAAFEGYFGKSLTEASIAESAMIAGLLVAPGRYSPYLNPAAAKARQEYVLKRMFENQKITMQEYKDALGQDLILNLKTKNSIKAPYFSDWVRQKMIEKFGEENLSQKGLRIKTTLDYPAQELAEKIIIKGLKEIDKRQGYSGPKAQTENFSISWLKDHDKIARDNFVKEKSTYFKLNKKREKIYEYDQYLKNFETSFSMVDNNTSTGSTWPGLSYVDNIQDIFTEGENFDVVVTAINEQEKIAFVSLFGIPGIITLDSMKWARKREISEKSVNFPQLSKISEAFTIGSVIKVSLKKKLSSLDDRVFGLSPKSKFLLSNKKLKYLQFELDQDPELQGSLLSINPKNGEIIAFIGGTNFLTSQFNRVLQSKRQPGSAFKPLLYAAALENGYTPTSIIMDSPESLSGVTDDFSWKPKNYDNDFLGPVTFREALEQSRNIPTIKIAYDLGINTIHTFAKRVGFTATMDKDLSLSLGSFVVTLMDLVQTYSIFPNGGKAVKLKFVSQIYDSKGKPIQDDINDLNAQFLKEFYQTTVSENTENVEPEKNIYKQSLNNEQIYDSRLAYLMCNLLKGVIQGPKGTGGAARDLSSNIAGKTGTTTNYIDAWFVGFSQSVATGVWVGFDDNKTMGHGETGSRSALPMWKEFMKFALDKFGDNEFTRPEGIVNALIDRKSGEIVTGKRDAFIESFAEGMPLGPTFGAKVKSISDQNSNDIPEEEDYYNNQ